MLSILIIDSEIIDHYSKYSYFFERFENDDEIAVCVWNRNSGEDDVAATVPQLMETIRNVPAWNAYIICAPHNSIDYLDADFKNKTQYSINPYERANREDYAVDNDPLLKLVYYLGGRGDNCNDHDEGEKQVNNIRYITQYQFRAARPDNIYLITTRIFKSITQQKHFLLTEIQDEYKSMRIYEDPRHILAGKVDVTRNYSEFWERYEYPANCRFMVYDIPEENHQKYEDSWFPFWISVISLTKNSIRNAILAPYKLHLLSVDINDKKYAEYINRFYTMLVDNKNINESEIKAEKDQIKLEAANNDITVTVGAMTPVFVNFPHVAVGDLFADDSSIGLYKDKPVLDEDDWHRQMQRTRESIAKFFKAIGRGKNEAVDFTNDTFSQEAEELKNRCLTKYDVEELNEAINEDEMRMIELNTGYAASRAEFEKNQRKAERIVRTYMKRRLKFKIASVLLAVCMLIYFIGFVPFLINSIQHSFTSFLVALPISAAAIVVPLISGLIALGVLKHNMKKLIGLYNGVITDCYETARAGAEIQGEYLTLLLDYMKKYQMLSNATFDSIHTKNIERLMIANVMFDDAIAECAALAALRNISLDRITDKYVENTIETTPGAHIYLYESNEGGKMALNGTPEVLDAPFPFTDNVSLETEELYECTFYLKSNSEDEPVDNGDNEPTEAKEDEDGNAN